MNKMVWLGVMVGLAWSGGTPFALEPASLMGTVVSPADGKDSPAPSQVVRLRIFTGDRETSGMETRSKADGSYRFSKLEGDENNRYQVYTLFDGARFELDPITFSSQERRRTLEPIRIYPTTGALDAVSTTESVIVEFGKNDLARVTHTATLANEGELAYRARRADASSIQFTVPPGSFELSLLQGLSRQELEVGNQDRSLAFRISLNPGEKRKVRFSYLVTLENHEWSFDLSSNVTRKAVNLLVAGQNPTVDSAQLERQPDMPMNDKIAEVYSGGPIAPNAAISISMSGLTLRKDIGFRWLGVGAVVCLLGLLWMGWTRPGQLSRNAQIEKILEQGYAEWIALDEQKRQGNLSETDHRADVQAVRSRLSEVLFESRQDRSG